MTGGHPFPAAGASGRSAAGALGPYRLVRVLGRGGMGVVYLARHRSTGGLVALKTVQFTVEASLASIRREILALAQLRHPGVIRILDYGISDELPWYAMEWMRSRTLRDLLREAWRGSISTGMRVQAMRVQPPPRPASAPRVQELLRLVRRLCTPLAYLHGLGVVHCDLKPSNVFIREDGSVVVGDFGISARFGGASGRDSLEVHGALHGTPPYMAPEQLRGEWVDARADLYALGCILHECVTGVVPSPERAGVVEARRPTGGASVLPASRSLPERLEWLIARLLADRPEERLGYAEDVARMLVELGFDAPEPRDAPRPQPYVYRPAFVGRTEAMRRTTPPLDRLISGEGGRLFIGGESGVGKTRLALEMARRALHCHLAVVTCECPPPIAGGAEVGAAATTSPLQSLRPLLATVADRCRDWGPEECAHVLGARGKVLAAYEPALDALPGQEELPPPPPLPPTGARARVLAALREVLFTFAEEDPVLLIVDDLQWADELTLDFLRSLRTEELAERGVLLLGTYRQEELTDEVRELIRDAGPSTLELSRLDEPSIRALASGMLALHTPPPPKLVALLARASNGNPFFVTEYLRAAIAEGLLYRDEAGRWVLKERATVVGALKALALPSSIEELIRRRLRDLSPEAQTLVAMAAVLGRQFDADVLLDATSLGEATALEALEVLRVRQILEEAPGERLRFAHDKLQEVSYAQLPVAEHAPLHRRAAEAIEKRYSGSPDLPRFYPSLGRHWSKARAHDRASRAFALGAARARDAYSNHEAISLYRAAIAELQELPREAEDGRTRLAALHEALGDVLTRIARQAEARATYRQALAELEEWDRIARGRLHRKLGNSWLTHHQHDEALHAYDEAEACLGPPPDEARVPGGDCPAAWWTEWVDLHFDRCRLFYWQDQVEEMSAVIARLRPVVEARGAPQQRARLYYAMLNLSHRRHRYAVPAETVELGRLAVRASDESGNPSDKAVSRFMYAFALLFHGDLAEAEAQGLEGLRLAERMGDLSLMSRLLTYLTLVYRKSGRLEDVRRLAKRSLAVSASAGMDDYVGAARANQAWVAWREGRFSEAEEDARAALALWRKLAVRYPYPVQWLALWILLAAALRRGTLGEAVEYALAMRDSTQQRLEDAVMEGLEESLRAWNTGQETTAQEKLDDLLWTCARLGYV